MASEASLWGQRVNLVVQFEGHDFVSVEETHQVHQPCEVAVLRWGAVWAKCVRRSRGAGLAVPLGPCGREEADPQSQRV